jgi:hypothetical protein
MTSFVGQALASFRAVKGTGDGGVLFAMPVVFVSRLVFSVTVLAGNR